MRSTTKAILWLIALSLLAATAILRHPSGAAMLDTNILNLLPENKQDPLAQKAFNEVAGSMEDQVLFLISADTQDQTIKAARAFETDLQTLPLFSKINGKLSDEEQSAWVSTYAPYRYQLLTQEQRQILKHAPATQTAKVIQQVYNPFSGVTGAELSGDPFLLFRDYLQTMNKQNQRFSITEGYLTTEQDGTFYVLIRGTLSGSAYSMQTQQQLTEIAQLEEATAAKFDAQIFHTGVVFYAAFGTDSAKSEISTIGVGSMLGILLLVLWIYRSLLPVSLTLLSIGTGVVTAFSVCLLVFGQIHLFSLVIGASLIGVSIDYAFHYLTDRLASGASWRSEEGLKRVFVPITFGLISTLIAYLSMLAAPFPGLQQLALFSASGLFGAYLSVIFWYPLLTKRPARYQTLPLANSSKGYLMLWQRPLVRIAMPVAALLVALIGFFNADYDDNIRQLQSLPPSLQEQESVIRSVTGLSSSQPMLLVKGSSEQQVLENAYALTPALEKLQSENALSGYQNPADMVPPAPVQRENLDLVQSLYQSEGEKLAAQIGLATAPKIPSDIDILTPSKMLNAPSDELFSSLWLRPDEGQYAAIVILQNATDMSTIRQAIAPFPEVSVLNKAEEVSTLFGQYRLRISILMGIACLGILGLLCTRFGVRRAVRILTPPLLAAGVALTAGAISPVPMNLFNLLALFLVLGIGIDYTLFFAEHKDSYRALVANTLAALTTILSFGLLSLSQTEAIHSFGVTVLVGIGVAWLLAPLAIQQPEKELHQ
ncbi:MMPL family transporter [Grimontia sp. NTOU-MAR1]|uniref:MMPL family transporter n=1 Tax=Grimontia sp. NTOU-MAR1 TaxID=3111011 RepID=UPI002DB6E151|nr:MMPL family transporter [Grimontia sp. NTOU-MAR1]WRV97171.1 MMPL family transporter [Grimontia sp. NTOU-MAR1]